jgi:hypothetical protein
MKSSTTPNFRKRLAALPAGIRSVALKNYRLWRRNPHHPSLHFKRVGDYWSVRVGAAHRALGRQHKGQIVWFWIGPHDEYERVIGGF